MGTKTKIGDTYSWVQFGTHTQIIIPTYDNTIDFAKAIVISSWIKINSAGLRLTPLYVCLTVMQLINSCCLLC